MVSFKWVTILRYKINRCLLKRNISRIYVIDIIMNRGTKQWKHAVTTSNFSSCSSFSLILFCFFTFNDTNKYKCIRYELLALVVIKSGTCIKELIRHMVFILFYNLVLTFTNCNMLVSSVYISKHDCLA